MEIVSWKESYTVGNEQIDHEHMVFIKIIGRIHEAIVKQKPTEDIMRIMRELETYAVFHFVSEENIMIDSEFPDFAEHKKEHEKLLNTLYEKLKDIISAEEHPRALVSFLLDWFVQHTTTRDIELARHLATIS
jgi:hemerythrin